MNPEIRKDSEEYARQEAEREDVWQEKYGRKLPELCGRFDEILRGEDEGKTERLEVLLQSDEVKEHYQMTEEIAAVTLGVMIAKRERCPGKNEGILSGIVSVKQMESRLRKMRFAIYGMEFLDAEVAEEGLYQCMEEERLTIIGFVTGVVIMAVHPLRVMLFMEKCFERRKMYGIEIVLLEYITQMWEGNQRMLCKLAELYERMQGEESAVRLRKELVDYKGECGEREQIYLLQEKLWHLRYGDQEAVEELLKQMGETNRGEELLFRLLEQEKPWTPEQYVSVADAWFAVGRNHIGQRVLEIGNRETDGEVQKILQNLKNREKTDE